MDPAALRAQHDGLQAQLATRSSTYHFAHAAVAMVVSLVVAGTSAKLSWDSHRYWYAGVGVGVLAVACWSYALIHYRIGKRHLGLELERFASLQSLRRTLQLDDPSALLPE